MKKLILILILPFIFFISCISNKNNSKETEYVSTYISTSKKVTEYNSTSNEIQVVGSYFEYKTTSSSSNNIIEKIKYDNDNNIIEREITKYNSLGKILENKRYNSSGELDYHVIKEFNSLTYNKHSKSKKYDYEYKEILDYNDNILERYDFNKSDEISLSYTQKFDSNNNLIEKIIYKNSEIEKIIKFEYNQEDETPIKTIYDKNNNLIHKQNKIYDKNNNLIEHYYTNYFSRILKDVYKYNDQNKIVEKVTYRYESDEFLNDSKIIYTYNDNNEPILEESYIYNHETFLPKTKTIFNETNEIEEYCFYFHNDKKPYETWITVYNNKKRTISRSSRYSDNKIYKKEEIKYNNNDRVIERIYFSLNKIISKVIYEYDEQLNELIKETFYKVNNSEEFILDKEIDYTFVPNPELQ